MVLVRRGMLDLVGISEPADCALHMAELPTLGLVKFYRPLYIELDYGNIARILKS